MVVAHTVTVAGLPAWVDAERLLGAGTWRLTDALAHADLDGDAAADLSARLRGVGLGGRLLTVTVHPKLSRSSVRRARTIDARRRRDTTPGFDRPGIRADKAAKLMLTPASLAWRLGQRYAGRSVVDVGCGAGGNTIGFARAGCRVTAIEPDAERLAMARHNAQIYGVAERIQFVHGDDRRLPPSDFVFVDPPWGEEWPRDRCGLEQFDLLGRVMSRAALLVAKLPPSFDPRDIAGASAEAVFGEAPGDRQRIKFVLLTVCRA